MKFPVLIINFKTFENAFGEKDPVLVNEFVKEARSAYV